MRTQIDKLGKVAVTVEADYWDVNRDYDKLTIVEAEGKFATYISRRPVLAGTPLTDRYYWIPFSSLKEEILLAYNSWVNNYGGMINSQTEILNNIQLELNKIMKCLPTGVLFSGNINYYPWHKNAVVSLHANVVNGVTSKFSLYDNENLIYESEGLELDYDVNVSKDTIFTLVTKQGGYTFRSEWSVTQAFPIYAGAVKRIDDVKSDAYIVKVDTSIDGLYSLVSNKNNVNIVFLVPKNITPEIFKMSGIDIPMEAAEEIDFNETKYNIYKSSNTYISGLYDITVNDYTGINKDEYRSLLDCFASSATQQNLRELELFSVGIDRQLRDLEAIVKQSGTTENRPITEKYIGQMYFDTTIGKPIFWNGSNWIDSQGNTI